MLPSPSVIQEEPRSRKISPVHASTHTQIARTYIGLSRIVPRRNQGRESPELSQRDHEWWPNHQPPLGSEALLVHATGPQEMNQWSTNGQPQEPATPSRDAHAMPQWEGWGEGGWGGSLVRKRKGRRKRRWLSKPLMAQEPLPYSWQDPAHHDIHMNWNHGSRVNCMSLSQQITGLFPNRSATMRSKEFLPMGYTTHIQHHYTHTLNPLACLLGSMESKFLKIKWTLKGEGSCWRKAKDWALLILAICLKKAHKTRSSPVSTSLGAIHCKYSPHPCPNGMAMKERSAVVLVICDVTSTNQGVPWCSHSLIPKGTSKGKGFASWRRKFIFLCNNVPILEDHKNLQQRVSKSGMA